MGCGAMILNRFIVVAMMACLAASLVRFGARVGWDAGYLIVTAALVAVEAMISHRLLAKRVDENLPWWALRLGEWVMILVVLRVVVTLQEGSGDLLTSARDWVLEPGMMFDGSFVMASAVTVTVWLLAATFANELTLLEPDAATLEIERRSRIHADRPDARAHMANRILAIGGVMAVLSTLATMQVGLANVPPPVRPASGIAVEVLIYLALGLLIMSRTQLALLRLAWTLENVPVSREVSRRWGAYSLVMVGTLALVASTLPTRYSLGLLETLRYLLLLAWQLVQVVAFLVALPLGILQGFVSWLTNLLAPAGSNPPPALPPPPPSQAPESSTPLPWAELVKSVLFWGLLVLLVVYLVRQYLREHPGLAEAIKKLSGFAWLLRGLKWLRQQVAWSQQALAAGRARLRRRRHIEATPAHSAPRLVRPDRDSPRAWMLYYYLAMVERAAARGMPRQAAETPSEFERRMKRALAEPDMAEAVSGLTEGFVVARYSRHEVTAEGVSRARAYWDAIRKALSTTLT